MGHVPWPSHDQPKASVLLLPGVVCKQPLQFIIDSGAERSVLPHSAVPHPLIFENTTKLSTVDGRPLKTYGHCQVSVGIKSLRRDYKVNFILTDTKPILGIDFLTEHGLILNMKDRLLTDSYTNVSATLLPGQQKEV